MQRIREEDCGEDKIKRRCIKMSKWVCSVCGYIYDEEDSGTAFEDLPDDWVCPACGVGKEAFEKED